MARPLRVLVVDDELLIADYLASVIEDAGHEVVGVSVSAEGAMRLARAHNPDLALLDIRLEGPRDGIDLAGDLRASGIRMAHIFISGHTNVDLMERAESTRPLAFFAKPFDSRKLVDAMRSLSAGRA